MKKQNKPKKGEHIDLFPETLKNPVGRPRKYANAAERQKAYRERLKAAGKRVVSRTVADVRDKAKPLHSDVIDLSEAWSEKK